MLHFSSGAEIYVTSAIPSQITFILFHSPKWLFHTLFSFISPVSSPSFLLCLILLPRRWKQSKDNFYLFLQLCSTTYLYLYQYKLGFSPVKLGKYFFLLSKATSNTQRAWVLPNVWFTPSCDRPVNLPNSGRQY